MSDETHDRCCGEAIRKGCSVEDLYCGGPLVIELSGADIAVRSFIETLEAARQQMFEVMAVPRQLLSTGPRLSDSIFEQKAGIALALGDGVALGSAEHPAGDPVPEDADISAEAVETVETDLEDEGQCLADLLALVRPPDDTFSYNDDVFGRHERYDQWNKPLDQNGVLLISQRDKIALALLHYGTEDYAEILKRFSDPEFRAAHNLEKRPDFSAVTRDIARS